MSVGQSVGAIAVSYNIVIWCYMYLYVIYCRERFCWWLHTIYHAIKWKQLMFYVIYVIEDGYRLPAQLLVVETTSGCLDSITASCRSVHSTDVSCAPWKLSGLSSAIGTWHTKAIKGLTALTHDIHHVDKDPITLTCRKLKEVEQMLVTDLQEANRRDWNSSRDSSWTLMILMKSDERGRTRQKLDLQDFVTRYIMWIHDDSWWYMWTTITRQEKCHPNRMGTHETSYIQNMANTSQKRCVLKV